MKAPTWSLVLVMVAAGIASARPKVVLDPGHGGANTGARGVGGVYEKQVTRALVDQLAATLRARDIDVAITRTGDRSLTLRQRVAFANAEHADLFVSVHTNASPTRTQRGYEAWVLTARGVDIDGRALRADTGAPRDGVDREIGLVLDDVERGAAQYEAAELASKVRGELRARRGTGLVDRGVRQDAHHVLLGATMPAVLVEVGFLDHPIEGKELADPAVQAQIVDALARAIADQVAE